MPRKASLAVTRSVWLQADEAVTEVWSSFDNCLRPHDVSSCMVTFIFLFIFNSQSFWVVSSYVSQWLCESICFLYSVDVRSWEFNCRCKCWQINCNYRHEIFGAVGLKLDFFVMTCINCEWEFAHTLSWRGGWNPSLCDQHTLTVSYHNPIIYVGLGWVWKLHTQWDYKFIFQFVI